jgi:hypothetical protein
LRKMEEGKFSILNPCVELGIFVRDEKQRIEYKGITQSKRLIIDASPLSNFCESVRQFPSINKLERLELRNLPDCYLDNNCLLMQDRKIFYFGDKLKEI